MAPRVSIVIPAYNTERYIGRAIESSLAQTERDLELLVVDDASTDGTVDVVKSFSDRRLRLMGNERNRGPGYTRNRAIREARGEWVALLDSDDWFAPERLERLLHVAQTESADLVADDMHFIMDGADHPWTTLLTLGNDRGGGIRHIDAVKFVESNMPGRRCSRLGLTKPLIRRNILSRRESAYREDVRYAQDFLLYLDCLLDGARFILVPEPYYFYRRRQGSLVTEGKLARLTSYRKETLRLLRQERVERTPGLAQALSERLSTIEQRILYYRVIQPLKEKDLRRAIDAIVKNPDFFTLFAAQVPRILHHRILRRIARVGSA